MLNQQTMEKLAELVKLDFTKEDINLSKAEQAEALNFVKSGKYLDTKGDFNDPKKNEF